jgi:hypothetical protein
VVDIQELVPSLRPMPQKEVEDQLRDWALYGLLMELGLGADELARTTHQLAPVRLPYLEELFAFEYGRGRRAILSDERVLLLYEQNDPDPQATLGRLADRVRMELGRVPGSFELYTFTSNVTAGELRLELREAVSGSELFSKKYGYHEAVVTSSQELGHWLGAVDDVVYVAQVSKGLKLGGRRFERSRTRSASLEDVAALYQAHSGLAAQVQQQNDQFQQTLSKGKSEIEASIPAMQEEVARLFPRDRQAQHQELNKRVNERWRQIQIAAQEQVRPVPPEPGFSLDPRLKGPGLAATLAELAANPCRALDTLKGQLKAAKTRLASTQALPGMAVYEESLLMRKPEDFRARCEALGKEPYRSRLQKVAMAAQELVKGAPEKEALAPLRALRNELKGSKDETQLFLLEVLGFAQEAHGEQCARYDGPLGGTRVGMNLFYTDLLAKLWTLDVQRSAPGLRVPGFISKSRLPPTAFREEALALSTTRTWFGPRKEAVTRSEDDTELRFQHVATRVFAAGSDPDRPEYLESAPAEDSRRAVGWWERHYADVADYEQEYHLQNQIMKWSVITGFFRAKALAPYLEQVSVSRTAQFGKWYEQTRSKLRYLLPLLVEGEVGQECMDLLSADSGISGGVSLAGTKLDVIPALKPTAPASLRHGLASVPPAKPAPGDLGRAFPRLEKPGVIKVEPVSSTKTRMGGVQVELGPIELAHARVATGHQMTLRTQQAPVGDFISTKTGDRLHLSWRPQAVAEAPALAMRVTGNDGAIPVAVTLYPGKAGRDAPFRTWPTLVSVPDSYDVLVPAASGNGYLRVRLSNGATAHAPPVELSSVLAKYKWQRFSVDKAANGLETSQGVVRRALNEGPGPDAKLVHLEGVEGFPKGRLTFAADNGMLYVQRPSDPRVARYWYELDQSAALTQKDLNDILTAAANDKSKVLRSDLSDPRAERAARALVAGDEPQFQRLLEELGPEQGSRKVQRHVEAAADFQLAQGNSREASSLYELARDRFGESSPGVLIRETVAEMHAGKKGPSSLQEVLERHDSKLTPEERVKVVKATLGLEDMPDVPHVLLPKLGFKSPIPDEVAPRIHLERDGPDVVSSYHAQKPLNGETVPPAELKKGLPPDATFYVEDGVSFNKNDFQANPGASVAELGQNPEVVVTRIRDMETGAFRPGKVYTKQDAAQGTASERVYRRVAGPIAPEKTEGSIFFIQSRSRVPPVDCDLNKDGKVSDEELRQCKAA